LLLLKVHLNKTKQSKANKKKSKKKQAHYLQG